MLFTKSHEWVDEESLPLKVGITNFAEKELGDIVFVELPKVGAKVLAGQEACVLESTKAAADVYSPLSGIIKEVNTRLIDDPGLINRSAQEEGWLFKVEISSKDELKSLMTISEYKKMLSI